MRFPAFLIAGLAPLMLGLACRHPKPAPQKGIQVQVSSTPDNAAIFLGGKSLGTAPQVVSVAAADDLLTMTATLAQEPVVEKRIRFLSLDQAEVRFVFGEGNSVMAKALGMARILVFDYGAAVTFEVDHADLKPEFLPLLDRQAELLKSHFQDMEVLVCGHTDSVGAPEHNLSLSLDRARAVSDDLGSKGVPKVRLKIQGFGSTFPIADNGTEQGRAQNRRTEIILPMEDR